MVYCNLCHLIFIHLFQYNCCLSYDIKRTHTAHIMTHYIKIEMAQFQARMKDFTQRNIQWIKKVSRDVLDKSQLTVDSFVKGLIGGTIFFDELCLTAEHLMYIAEHLMYIAYCYWMDPIGQLIQIIN